MTQITDHYNFRENICIPFSQFNVTDSSILETWKLYICINNTVGWIEIFNKTFNKTNASDNANALFSFMD